MASLLWWLAIYLLGGFTLIPVLIILTFLHAYLTFPKRDLKDYALPRTSLLLENDDSEAVKAATDDLDEKFKSRGAQSNDVFAGYFAVCREYVPAGVGAKPPERVSPTGSMAISSPSPSVYQSMYRSIFDRKQSASPIDSKNAARPQKKGGNIFYVVLRHNHLMLFDDEEQIEVRYVISLDHHHISIYGGGEAISDGELFIKRNALCLSRRSDTGELSADGIQSKPFFLFSDNTSQKEDIYFSILKNQDRTLEPNPPIPLQFDVKHMIGLVQRLHSSEEHLQTRWINALIGRIFLGLYKTSDVENYIRAKITKKISRVKTPTFLSKIVLQAVDTGESAPYITNPRLKDLTVDGECSIEADIKYTGRFRLEVAATARIDLGSRFKVREVDLVIAVVVKRVEGHMQMRIKPPPSNRLWYTFTSMPKIEMSIEPIVSSRQITYTFILRQIESRIKEVIAESIVLPFWDDTAFFSTEGKRWRGGVWVDDTMSHAGHSPEQEVAEHGDVDAVENMEENLVSRPEQLDTDPLNPVLQTKPSSSIFARKAAKSVFNNEGATKAVASSTSVDTTRSMLTDHPRVMRVGSFSGASDPTLSTDITNADTFRASSPPEHSHAAAAMAALASKSASASPTRSPIKVSGTISGRKPDSLASSSSRGSVGLDIESSHELGESDEDTMHDHREDHSFAITDFERSSDSIGSSSMLSSLVQDAQQSPQAPKLLDSRASTFSSISTRSGDSNASSTSRRPVVNAVANAAVAAKRWGLDALAARRGAQQAAKESGDRQKLPMGRGRPLPPPGMPLPPPDRKTKTAPMPVPKRKPIPGSGPAFEPQINGNEQGTNNFTHAVPDENLGTHYLLDRSEDKAPPLPDRNRQPGPDSTPSSDGLFVVEAPEFSSEPTTPMQEHAGVAYVPIAGNYAQTAETAPRKIEIEPLNDSLTDSVDISPQSRPDGLKSTGPDAPTLIKRRSTSRSISVASREEDAAVPIWAAAQEEDARSKSILVDEDSGTLHQ